MITRGKTVKDYFTSEVDLQLLLHTLSERASVAVTLQKRGPVTIRINSITAIPSDASHWQFRGHITQEKGSIPYSGEFSTTTGIAWIQTEEQS